MATAWCPDCGAEYRPGFTFCSDCHVPLVSQPPEPADSRPTPREPFTGRIVEVIRLPRMEAEVLVARLRAYGLRASAHGSDEPYGSITFAQGVGVFVPEEDLAAATEILRDEPSD